MVHAVAKKTVWVAAIVAMGSCGDNTGLPCLVEDPVSLDCVSSVEFASRNSSTLLVDQHDVTAYYSVWEQAVLAEPFLGFLVARRQRGTEGLEYQLHSSDPAVLSKWASGESVTGNASVDGALRDLEPTLVPMSPNPSADTYSFQFGVWFSEDRLVELLADTPVALDPPGQQMRSMEDIAWTWQSSGDDPLSSPAWIDAKFGWGDCFVKCDGYHELRVVVANGVVTGIYDIGGDPLPPYITFAPGTIPWPE